MRIGRINLVSCMYAYFGTYVRMCGLWNDRIADDPTPPVDLGDRHACDYYLLRTLDGIIRTGKYIKYYELGGCGMPPVGKIGTCVPTYARRGSGHGYTTAYCATKRKLAAPSCVYSHVSGYSCCIILIISVLWIELCDAVEVKLCICIV